MNWLSSNVTHRFSELDKLAKAAWADTLGTLGFPTKGWDVSTLSRRDDPHISRISLLVSHAQKGMFTFKFQLRPQAEQDFADQYAMQEQTFKSFPQSETLGVAEPVFVDASQHVSLLRYMAGDTLTHAMHDAAEDVEKQLDLLRQCGQWLDAFHRSAPTDARPLQPKFTLNLYGNLKSQITSGETKVAVPDLILKGIETLFEQAPVFEGKPTMAAVQHGDFHMQNLIYDGVRLSGIDISKNQVAPVGYDIAKLLLDYTIDMRGAGDLSSGQVVPEDAIDAFFDGYTLVGPDDPSFRFLIIARVLGTLNLVPANPSERSLGKERTLSLLTPIAQTAFGVTPSKETPEKNDVLATVFLTSRSLKRAHDGDHEFVQAIQKIAKRKNRIVKLAQDTPANRNALGSGAQTLVHMSHPAGPNGLVFRKLYGGSFYRIENLAERWHWQLAQAKFNPDKISSDVAQPFFEHWRDTLFGADANTPTQDGFIYMPMQGRLLKHRLFQSMSPVDMISTTLAQTKLPIIATLHPNETYTEEELQVLSNLEQDTPRFTLGQDPMASLLRRCDFVVTQNSSVAFHGAFFKKKALLFAGAEFHHAFTSIGQHPPAKAFEALKRSSPEFAKFIYWFWKLNAIDLAEKGHVQKLIKRLKDLGWTL